MAAEEALSLLGTLAPGRARLSMHGFSPELDESGRTLRSRTLVPITTRAAQRGIRSSRLAQRAPRWRHGAL